MSRRAWILALVGLLTPGIARQTFAKTSQEASECQSLVSELASDVPGVRARAAGDLGQLGSGGACAVDALRTLLRKDMNDVVKDAVAEALGNIGPAALRAAPDLMVAAPKLRFPKTALNALAMLGPKVIPYVVPWLDEVVDQRRDRLENAWLAAVVFARIGAPAVPALIEALKVPARQTGAANSLGAIGPAAATAVPSLVTLYEKSGRDAPLYEIVKALGMIGPAARASIPLLERVAAGKDPRTADRPITRQAAQSALVRIRGDKQ